MTASKTAPLNTIIINNRIDESERILRVLNHGGIVTDCTRIDNAVDLQDRLEERVWDLAVVADDLPDWPLLDITGIFESHRPHLSLIVISSQIDPLAAHTWLSKGVRDVVDRSHLDRLIIAIQREIMDQEKQRRVQENLDCLGRREEHLRLAMENSTDILAVIQPDGRIEYIAGFIPDRIPTGTGPTSIYEFIHPDVQGSVGQLLERVSQSRVPEDYDLKLRARDGWYEMTATPFISAGQVTGITLKVSDVTQIKKLQKNLEVSEARLKLKHHSMFMADEAADEQEIRNILDIRAIQDLITDLHRLTGMGIAIGDMDNNVIAAIGGQEVCARFHRANEVSARRCRESDLYLTEHLKRGEYAYYKCKNGLWDAATPLFIGDKQVGTVYTGQFFYDDEEVDYDLFMERASWYGFEREAYRAALQKVPRFSHERVEKLMSFLVRFTGLLSELGSSNLKLTRLIAEQSQTAAALGESQGRLARITENANIMVCRMSLPAGRYDYVSAAAEAITGYSPEVFMANPRLIAQIIHPDWIYYMKTEWNNLLDGNVPPEYEYQIIHRSGETRWIHQHNTMILGDDGAPTALESMVSDITERKQMEGRISRERALLRSLIDSISDLVSLKDLNGAYLGCNQAMAAQMGRQEADIIGLTDYDLFETGRAARIREQDQAVMSSGCTHTCENQMSDRQNRQRLMETVRTPFRGPEGQILGIIAISRDITERKASEEELLKSEARFRSYFQSPQVGIAITSVDYQWIEVNDCLCAMLGYTREQLVTMTWAQLTHPDDLEPDLIMFRKVLNGSTDQYCMEKRFITGDGQVIRTDMAVSCVRNPRGEAEYFMATLLNISDRIPAS